MYKSNWGWTGRLRTIRRPAAKESALETSLACGQQLRRSDGRSTRCPQRRRWETGSSRFSKRRADALATRRCRIGNGTGAETTGPRCGALRSVVGWEPTVVMWFGTWNWQCQSFLFPAWQGPQVRSGVRAIESRPCRFDQRRVMHFGDFGSGSPGFLMLLRLARPPGSDCYIMSGMTRVPTDPFEAPMPGAERPGP